MVLSKELHFEHVFILGIHKRLSTQKSTCRVYIRVRIVLGEVRRPN